MREEVLICWNRTERAIGHLSNGRGTLVMRERERERESDGRERETGRERLNQRE